jgi:hypothetical protein
VSVVVVVDGAPGVVVAASGVADGGELLQDEVVDAEQDRVVQIREDEQTRRPDCVQHHMPIARHTHTVSQM